MAEHIAFVVPSAEAKREPVRPEEWEAYLEQRADIYRAACRARRSGPPDAR